MTSHPTAPRSGAPLRVGFVAGVTPDKWARVWAERMPGIPLELAPVDDGEQTAVLYDGRADMCFVRLPVDDERLHVIPLYTEVTVVVVPRGHFVEAADEVTFADLAGEHVHPVPPLTMREAVDTVASGVGIVVVPMSVARLHHRKDLTHRPVVDADGSRVGLAWRRDLDDDRVQNFIGVVRGRSAHSSRGPTPLPGTPPAEAPRRGSGGEESRRRRGGGAPGGRSGRSARGRRRR